MRAHVAAALLALAAALEALRQVEAGDLPFAAAVALVVPLAALGLGAALRRHGAAA